MDATSENLKTIGHICRAFKTLIQPTSAITNLHGTGEKLGDSDYSI